MASFNRVILIGNLTRDIDLRSTPSGTSVADASLAVNDRRKNQAGEWVEETTFVDVTVWGRTAEVACEHLSKGSPILIEGRLKLEQWETNGQKRSKLKVVAERMQMLGHGGSISTDSPLDADESPTTPLQDAHDESPTGFASNSTEARLAAANIGGTGIAGECDVPTEDEDDIPF